MDRIKECGDEKYYLFNHVIGMSVDYACLVGIFSLDVWAYDLVSTTWNEDLTWTLVEK